jgi:hypothetical protein
MLLYSPFHTAVKLQCRLRALRRVGVIFVGTAGGFHNTTLSSGQPRHVEFHRPCQSQAWKLKGEGKPLVKAHVAQLFNFLGGW